MRPSTLAIAFGAGRALFGVALLAAPGPDRARLGRRRRHARRPCSTRSLGARDLVIGAGLVAGGGARRRSAPVAGGRRRSPTPSTASPPLAAGDDIPRNGRVATTALAGGSALFGAWLARAID